MILIRRALTCIHFFSQTLGFDDIILVEDVRSLISINGLRENNSTRCKICCNQRRVDYENI